MKRILLEIDDRYNDVLACTFIGMTQANNVWGCEMNVTSHTFDLRAGNHIILTPDGKLKQDKIEEL